MRKIIATEYLTLDGVMEDPGGSEKTVNGGWSFKFWGADAAKFKYDELFSSGALLLGRITYQGFAKAWPSMKDDAGFADRMNGIPKFVVSKTLEKAEWNNSTIIRENIEAVIKKMKEMPGQDILVAGSGELVKFLMKLDLVDEYRLMVHPVILGSGRKLFTDGNIMKAFKLKDAKSFDKGIVVLTYEPAGNMI